MIRFMCCVVLCAVLVLLCVTPGEVFAQNSLESSGLDLANDPDIDMFIGDWRESIPFNTHGTITERAILSPLTSGDVLNPDRKGEVMTFFTFSRGTIDGGAVTTPVTLTGEQEVFYFTAGIGEIRAAGKTYDVRDGIFVLMPEGLEFTIQNTGDDLLDMYIVREKVPAGFRPNAELLIVDEKTTPFREQGQVTGHWSHNGKSIFGVKDGTAELESISLITIDELCIAHPHSHGEGIEECWAVVDGKLLEMLGKQVRWLRPGQAFKVPPDGTTPHSHINPGDEKVRILIFARWRDHDPRP